MGANAVKFPFQLGQAQLEVFTLQIRGIGVIQFLYHALNGGPAQFSGIKLVLIHKVGEDDIPCLPHDVQPLALGRVAPAAQHKTDAKD